MTTTTTKRYTLDPGRAADRHSPEHQVLRIREAAGAGLDREAWFLMETLWKRIRRLVWAKLHRFIPAGGREDIHDDIQLRCYLAWRSPAPGHEFWQVKFWLCLDRLVMDVTRVDNRRRSFVADFDLAIDKGPGSLVPVTTSMTRTVELTATLAVLPEMERYVVTNLAEGYSQEAIARALGCTSRTVRNYLYRARKSLIAWR
jgi:DNA-directed RNA polymerase specialized sigma24 family protein